MTSTIKNEQLEVPPPEIRDGITKASNTWVLDLRQKKWCIKAVFIDSGPKLLRFLVLKRWGKAKINCSTLVAQTAVHLLR